MAKLADTITGARVLGSRIVTIKRRQNPDGRMPLLDHLRELRNRVLKAAAAIVAGMVVGLIPQVHDPLWAFIVHPFNQAEHIGPHSPHLVVIGVLDPFTIWLQLAFWFGLIVTCPIWLYQIWAFIAPGLYAREKKWTYAFVGTAAPLFLGGAAIAYWVMSRGLKYLLALAPSGIQVLPTISNYLSYFQAMLLGFGLAFELPLALVLANRVGILSHQRMAKWRRIIIFLVFVFAGVASPSPDPVTMLLLAIPCVALIEVAELIIWLNDRRRARIPSPYAGLSDDEASPLDLDMPSGDGVDVGKPGTDA
jgi:sec-independent protein translocase protein TatC